MNEENMKNSIRSSYHRLFKRGFSGITASSRVFPNFIIAGTVRSGTTSLYYNICEHPSVLPADSDEIGFFDSNYNLGTNWYRSMFPTEKEMKQVKKETNFAITGEDTPFYFWKKEAAERIFNLLPNCKIIIILRNPIDRAYSNYQLGKRTGWENLSFEETIEIEKKQLKNGLIPSQFDDFRSYLIKSIYSYQIKYWLDIFPKNQLKIISTEELSKNVKDTMSDLFKFLEISDYEIIKGQKMKSEIYPEMIQDTRNELKLVFRDYNEELFKLINKRFEWN